MPSISQPTPSVSECPKAVFNMPRPGAEDTLQFAQRTALGRVAPRENDGSSTAQIHEIPIFPGQMIEHEQAPAIPAKLGQTRPIPLRAPGEPQPQRMGRVTENPGPAPSRAVEAEHAFEILPALRAKRSRFFLAETGFDAGTVRNPPPQAFETSAGNQPIRAIVNPALQRTHPGERIPREIEEA